MHVLNKNNNKKLFVVFLAKRVEITPRPEPKTREDILTCENLSNIHTHN